MIPLTLDSIRSRCVGQKVKSGWSKCVDLDMKLADFSSTSHQGLCQNSRWVPTHRFTFVCQSSAPLKLAIWAPEKKTLSNLLFLHSAVFYILPLVPSRLQLCWHLYHFHSHSIHQAHHPPHPYLVILHFCCRVLASAPSSRHSC